MSSEFYLQEQQIPLTLVPRDPLSLRTLIPHSGISLAMEVIRERLSEVTSNPGQFRLVYIWGPPGSGKTHLLHAFHRHAVDSGIESSQVVVFDAAPDSADAHFENSGLVSAYDRLKTQGGLLFVSGLFPPAQLVENPHFRSRLMSGDVLQLSYPREEELRPLLQALSERFNLQLSEKSAQYVLERSASDPLSFSRILAKIDALSLTQNKKKAASLSAVRAALNE